MRLIKAKKAAKASADRNQSLGRPASQGDAKELLELQDAMQATRRGEEGMANMMILIQNV